MKNQIFQYDIFLSTLNVRIKVTFFQVPPPYGKNDKFSILSPSFVFLDPAHQLKIRHHNLFPIVEFSVNVTIISFYVINSKEELSWNFTP